MQVLSLVMTGVHVYTYNANSDVGENLRMEAWCSSGCHDVAVEGYQLAGQAWPSHLAYGLQIHREVVMITLLFDSCKPRKAH